jgi:hypothetical protein
LPDRFFNLDLSDEVAERRTGGGPRVLLVAQVVGSDAYLVALGDDPEMELRPARVYDRERDVLHPQRDAEEPLQVGSFTAHVGGDLGPVMLTEAEVAGIEAHVASLLDQEG